MRHRIVFSLLFWLAAGSAGAVTAVDDFVLAVEGNEVAISSTLLLVNDDIEEHGRWEVVLDAPPAWGDLSTGSNGFVYKAAAGAVVDSFTYYLGGNLGSSNSATVRIQVIPMWAPIAGDWDGDGDLEMGVLRNGPAPLFFLCEQMVENPVCPGYPLPSSSLLDSLGFLAVAGNWDSDPADEVGLYDPAAGRFVLFDAGSESTLTPLADFELGEGAKGNFPLAGDWNGDGFDTVGLLLAATGELGLRDENAGGGYDHAFSLTGAQAGWLPFAGDWWKDGTFGVGLYDPIGRRVYLRDDLTSGPAEWEIGIGIEEGSLVPLLGLGDPAGVPSRFELYLFTRTPSSLIFFVVSGEDGILPHLKIVIPTDPDGQING